MLRGFRLEASRVKREAVTCCTQDPSGLKAAQDDAKRVTLFISSSGMFKNSKLET